MDPPDALAVLSLISIINPSLQPYLLEASCLHFLSFGPLGLYFVTLTALKLCRPGSALRDYPRDTIYIWKAQKLNKGKLPCCRIPTTVYQQPGEKQSPWRDRAHSSSHPAQNLWLWMIQATGNSEKITNVDQSCRGLVPFSISNWSQVPSSILSAYVWGSESTVTGHQILKDININISWQPSQKRQQCQTAILSLGFLYSPKHRAQIRKHHNCPLTMTLFFGASPSPDKLPALKSYWGNFLGLAKSQLQVPQFEIKLNI